MSLFFLGGGGTPDEIATALTITDFEPGVDVLEIETEDLYESAIFPNVVHSENDPNWTEDDILRSEFAMAEVSDLYNGEDTFISLVYDAYDTDTGELSHQVTSNVVLRGVTGLTLADIPVT